MKKEAKIVVKGIECKDADILVSLFEQNNHPSITNTFHPFPLTSETANWIACQPHKDRFFVAYHGDNPVGFSMLRGWDDGYIIPSFGIFVDIHHQGDGIGTRILALTIEEARKLGCEKIRLSVLASNPAAIKIYKNKGFVEIERTEIDLKGNRVQNIIMMKDLTQ